MNQEKNGPTDIAADAQEFVITRTLNAPQDLVWRAWAEADRLAKWWGPKGCSIRVHRLDFHPGGICLYTMTFPGSEDAMWGRFAFREILAPQKLTWVNSFSDAEGGITRPPFDDNWPLEILNEMTLTEEADGKTLLTLRAKPINATSEEVRTFDENRESLRLGYGGTWDQLEEYLAGVA